MSPRSCAVALLVGAAFSASSLMPVDAVAQPADARETARPMAEKAYEAFEAKRWAEAIDHFRRAEAVYHALPHLLFIARAQVASGKLIDARSTYDAIVKEQLANYAPDAFRQAQDEARRELVDVGPRIPRLESVVTGADPSRVRLKVDGSEVFGWSAAGGIPLDPGTHVIVALTDTGATAERTVQLREGETTRVQLPIAAPATPPPDEAQTATPSTGGSYVPAILAFGVGGIGLAVGAVTGLASLGKVSDIEDKCTPTLVCPKSLEGESDSAKTLGTVSTLGFVIGGLGVGAGVVLLVTRSRKTEAPRAALRVGPGSLSVRGSF